jgi:hypothetical protein
MNNTTSKFNLGPNFAAEPLIDRAYARSRLDPLATTARTLPDRSFSIPELYQFDSANKLFTRFLEQKPSVRNTSAWLFSSLCGSYIPR